MIEIFLAMLTAGIVTATLCVGILVALIRLTRGDK